jgi:Spy/CpxP family protein refolding chaperone
MNSTPQHSSERWVKLSLMVLVVLNLALMATIWWPQLHRATPKEKAGIGGREREIAQRFLEETLSLSPQQKEAAAKLSAAHFQKTDAVRKEVNQLRRQIMDEVVAASPDKEKVERLATELGEKQGQMEKLTFAHFLDLYSLCEPDQKETFRSLMADLTNRLGPPPSDTPRRTREENPPTIERSAQKRTPASSMRPPSSQAESSSEVSRMDNQIERLRHRLSLSEAQVATLRPIVERSAREIDACRGQAYDDPRARDQAEKRIKDQRDQAISALLTAEQRALFEQLKQERRGPAPAAERPRND